MVHVKFYGEDGSPAKIPAEVQRIFDMAGMQCYEKGFLNGCAVVVVAGASAYIVKKLIDRFHERK